MRKIIVFCALILIWQSALAGWPSYYNKGIKKLVTHWYEVLGKDAPDWGTNGTFRFLKIQPCNETYHSLAYRAQVINNNFRQFVAEESGAVYGTHEYWAHWMTLQYRAYLQREPDAAGLANWVAWLDDGTSEFHTLNAFMSSRESHKLSKEICGRQYVKP